MRDQRRKRDQLVEYRHRCRTLRRPARAEYLAVLIDPDDPTLGRDRVHDPHTVLVQQRVELVAERPEASGLDFDQLAVGTEEVDHEPADRRLEAVARLGQQRLYGSMKRALAQHPDARHDRNANPRLGVAGVYSPFTPSHRGGSGPPLVCLHGFTDTWRTWELVLPVLERHHDVLAPTLLGHAVAPPRWRGSPPRAERRSRGAPASF